MKRSSPPAARVVDALVLRLLALSNAEAAHERVDAPTAAVVEKRLS